jgi:sugar (pentulose or hexulose) kinase
MTLALGLDLGTTTITALAVDTDTGEQAGCVTATNRAETTTPADRARGRCEWDAGAIVRTAVDCLRELAAKLGPRSDFAGLCLTGQQHGVVLVDRVLRPVSPLINWQDRRGDELCPATGKSWVETARQRVGPSAPRIAGCRLATGFMGVTLFRLAEEGMLAPDATACFIVDFATALLTGLPPVTDPTLAASAGLLDVGARDWDHGMMDALGLPRELFPPVRPSGERRGSLTDELAKETGLPAGLPVFVGIGDNQASFLGSVAQPEETTLVNVGTGGQVAVFTPAFAYDPALETRPFPGGGFLLVSAGLSGGAAYAVLERFFLAVGRDVLGITPGASVFDAVNRLAGAVPAGADGLRCEPFFTGTRLQPELRASWTGMSAANFTPGHLARALLEGMARTFAGSHDAIRGLHGGPARRLVGAGNGIRANPLLAKIIAEAFGLPLLVPIHREEAATGAARLAAVGAGVFPDLAASGRIIRQADEGTALGASGGEG